MENRDIGSPSGMNLVDVRVKMLDQLKDYVELLYWNKIQYIEFDFVFEKILFVISLSASGDLIDVKIKARDTILSSSVYEQFMKLSPGVKPTRRAVWDYVHGSQQFSNFFTIHTITNVRIKPLEKSNVNIANT